MSSTAKPSKSYREPRWHQATDRWCLKIGKKHSKDGRPVEAWHYWTGEFNDGNPPAEVVANAVQKQRDWEDVKANWSEYGPRLERAYCGPGDAKPDYTEP